MIPVLRPKLPAAHHILPYLAQIDQNRVYAGFGPLASAFEARLASRMQTQAGVLAVANASLALSVALQALEVPRGTLCLMAAWSHSATPAAALAAGLMPCFLDVESETQALSPEWLKTCLRQISGDVGAVIAVSPFGAPVDAAAWDRFTLETGIPAVIDASMAFDALMMGVMELAETPAVVSLHAEMVTGTGEGAFLASRHEGLIDTAKKLIDFGFEADGRSHRIACGAKISEYTAAVGMAALDEWEEIRTGWERVRDFYMDRLAPHGLSLWLDAAWVGSTCNILIPGRARALAEELRGRGVETRRWWLSGCHNQPAYRYCMSHGALNVTQWLGESLLGLPASADMPEHDLEKVSEAVLDFAASELLLAA